MDQLPAYLTGIIALLLLTSFIKIFTSLSILRYGLGLQAGSFGVVILGLSLALTLIVMAPQLGGAGDLNDLVGRSIEDAQLQAKLRPFIEKHAKKDVVARLSVISQKLAGQATSSDPKQPTTTTTTSTQPRFSVLIAAFVISQIQEAFYVGLLLLIPFVILDLVVANVLMALGVTQMPVSVIALPLKLLVFFSVNGWQLVSEKLLGGYL